MWQPLSFSLASFFCGVFLLATAATAQVPAMTFSVGYSNLQTQKTDNLFYNHDGAYVDADFSWRLPLNIPLQVGIGATGSGHWERQSTFVPLDNTYYPYDHLYSDLGLFELEPRIGLRLGNPTGFFFTPRIGAGLLIDSYAIDQTITNSNGTYLNTQYHTGAAFEVRPALQAGYCWGPAAAGIEASYMWSWGDFGELGRHADEFRVGAFFSLNF